MGQSHRPKCWCRFHHLYKGAQQALYFCLCANNIPISSDLGGIPRNRLDQQSPAPRWRDRPGFLPSWHIFHFPQESRTLGASCFPGPVSTASWLHRQCEVVCSGGGSGSCRLEHSGADALLSKTVKSPYLWALSPQRWRKAYWPDKHQP